MLTPEYLKDMPKDVVKLFSDLEMKIVQDISRRIAKDIELTATADYQISQLKLMGYDVSDIQKEIVRTTELAEEEVSELLKKSSYLSHENDQELYKIGGKTLPKLSTSMERMIDAQIKNTQNDLRNITKSLAFKGNNKGRFVKEYRDTLNYASVQLSSGAFTQNQVIKEAVQKLTNSGITKVRWESGSETHIDVAVRRAILTNSSQITGIMSEHNADLMEQDLMEITSHYDSRPSHSNWQGQIVSRSGAKGYLDKGDIGYGDIGGFKGANCRHDWFPYFEGFSTRIPDLKDDVPINYNGKEYDSYQASQKQRYHERQIRDSKREVASYKSAGLTEEAKLAQIKLNRQNAEYRRFSEAMGIRPKTERTGVAFRQ